MEECRPFRRRRIVGATEGLNIIIKIRPSWRKRLWRKGEFCFHPAKPASSMGHVTIWDTMEEVGARWGWRRCKETVMGELAGFQNHPHRREVVSGRRYNTVILSVFRAIMTS